MAMSKEEFEELKKPFNQRIFELYSQYGKDTLTTTEIRSCIDMSHQTLLKNLEKMTEDRELAKEEFPGSRVIFWKKL